MKLFPRIATYSLNAYHDAQISHELATHIKTQGKRFASIGTSSQQRAQKLANTGNGKSVDYLIGLAYTQYYINGLADISYGRILFKMMLSKEKPRLKQLYQESTNRFRSQINTPHQFEEFKQDRNLLRYLTIILSNPWLWAPQFSKERCGYSGGLNKEMLRSAAITVQEQNIENNRQVAQNLREGNYNHDAKTKELYRLASELGEKKFIEESARAQESAARWDKLFVKFISR